LLLNLVLEKDGESTLKSRARVRRYRMIRTLDVGLYAASKRAMCVASNVLRSSSLYVPLSIRSAVRLVICHLLGDESTDP
jgi:hypothetical protein